MEAGTELSRLGTLERLRSSRVRERALRFAYRVNLPLVAIVIAGTVLTAYFVVKVTNIVVLTDELQHVKLAISIADTLNPLPRVRGGSLNAYGQLYPLLTAPAYGLFDMPTAFKVVKALNALIMASTAVPAYLLCRAVLRSRGLALVVAALTAATPWVAMSALMMTEVAAYPAFAWAVYLIYRAIVEPRLRNDVLALVGIAIAVLARTQFVFLAAVLPVAVLAHELGYRPRAGRLRDIFRRAAIQHALLSVATVLGLLVVIALKATGRLSVVLGAYGGTLTGPLIPKGSGNFSAQLWGITVAGVGVIPAVAAVGWGASSLVRPSDRRSHAYAVLMFLVAIVLTWQVSSFLVRFSGTIQDRYFFYVVPLLFVGMAACLRDVRGRWVAILVATGLAAWATTTVDMNAGVRAFWASPPVTLNTPLTVRAGQVGRFFGIDNLTPGTAMVILALAAGVAFAIALWRMPRRPVLLVTCAALVLFGVATTAYTDNKFRHFMTVGGPIEGRDWVDRSLPDGAHAALLIGGVNATSAGTPTAFNLWTNWTIWWSAEFWNKRATRGLNFEDDPVAGDAPFRQDFLTADRRTGGVRGTVDTPYLVTSPSDPRQRMVGSVVAADPSSGLQMLRAPLPPRLDWMSNLGYNGLTNPGDVTAIRVFTPAGAQARTRRVQLLVNVPPDLHWPIRYSLRAPGGRVQRATVKPGATATPAVTVCSAAPHVDVKLAVPKTADKKLRVLHVAKVTVGPPGAPCGPRS